MIHGRSNLDILEELDGFVCGHLEAKKALISLVNRSKIRHHQKWIEHIHKDYLIQPHKLLLIGQSGTGKTHLVESLQELVDFPLVRVDATKLNPTGASGGVKEDELRKMIISKANEYTMKKRGFYHSLEGTIDQMVVFIDEIDKVARKGNVSGADVSREGVQRDLLPLIEGCTVTTKHGTIKTDHILFITSGAFHLSKPSDLIPELQGRLPIRVELSALTPDDFERILTEPTASLTEQQEALLKTEGVEITFTKDGIRRIAETAYEVNERTENIGARRLHTILERLLEDVSFEAGDGKTQVEINAAYVEAHVGELAKNEDLSRFIL